MSQRPPRNFRQRKADSGSSSDPDSDPGPSPDLGLGGRVSERALGAPRSRGRAHVWATSRRTGTSRSGPAPPDVHRAASESCSSSPEVNGGSSESHPATPCEDKDTEAEARDFLGSGSSGKASFSPGLQDDWSGAWPSLQGPQGPVLGSWQPRQPYPKAAAGGATAQEDYLPLSERPWDHVLDQKGSSDTDSDVGPTPRGMGIHMLRLRGAGEAASSSEGQEEGGSEGEALDVWEAQQMRKALRVTDVAPDPGLKVQNRHVVKRTLDGPVSFPPVNLEIIKKQLSSRLASLEGVHHSHQREYERVLQDRDSAKNTIADLEKVPDPAPTCAFYRGLKAYLAALVDCLSEKIMVIQQLESAMHSLLQERIASSLKRRQAELQEEAMHLQRLAGEVDGVLLAWRVLPHVSQGGPFDSKPSASSVGEKQSLCTLKQWRLSFKLDVAKVLTSVVGLLRAGTETGAFLSFPEGAPLQITANVPRTSWGSTSLQRRGSRDPSLRRGRAWPREAWGEEGPHVPSSEHSDGGGKKREGERGRQTETVLGSSSSRGSAWVCRERSQEEPHRPDGGVDGALRYALCHSLARKMDDAPAPGSLAEDVGAQKLPDEAAARRMRRRQARESSGMSQHQEDMSSDGDNDSDSMSPSEGSNFRERQGAILRSCHSVFEDVNEEFSDVQKILLKFQQWRERFPDSYHEAYASLCLPKLFSPFIRIQMLDWNPLKPRTKFIGTLIKPNCVSLQCMPWFQSLEGFAKSGAAAQSEEQSPDGEILPAALEKTVLPHITVFVRFFWDPVSTSQTRSLVQHCREILGLCAATRGRRSHATQPRKEDIGRNLGSEYSKEVRASLESGIPLGQGAQPKAPPGTFSVAFLSYWVLASEQQELMDSVVSRLKKAVEEDVFIPLYPKRLVEDKASPHASFQERQFWSAVQLLGNILLWDGLILKDALRELVLDKLLNRYLVIGLSNACPGPGVAEKYRRVVESLPKSWFSEQHAGSSIPQLASLTNALVQAAQQLHDSELGSEVGEMVLLLVKMKALMQARAFVERNQLDLLRSCVNAPQ
ncbi:LOW QUALITY PROTEIN: intron Large complex component GCFC2 [Phascolarctos cinereus]